MWGWGMGEERGEAAVGMYCLKEHFFLKEGKQQKKKG